MALAAAMSLLSLAAAPSFADTPPAGPFTVYPAPVGAADALLGPAEPSIGSNWVTGATLYQAGVSTYKVTFDPEHATSSWTDVTAPEAPVGQDPILWTDSPSGHTVTSQLFGECSLAAVTDTDGLVWLPSRGCGEGVFDDHQSVGGGRYHSPKPLTAVTDLAVYYCAHTGYSGYCSRSDNGGITFGPAVQFMGGTLPTDGPCGGLHGHIKVAPDGTVYVPYDDCGQVALAVSDDNGESWHTEHVTGASAAGRGDPAVAVGSGGTLYTIWQQGTPGEPGGKPFAAVSADGGKTWDKTHDLGAAFGIENIEFPSIVAGDDGRAAATFIGTPTPGDDQKGGSLGGCIQVAASYGTCTVTGSTTNPVKDVFPGVWHLYVSLTYDGGVTWNTIDVAPADPVQRGCVWLGGGGLTTCRNLFDFNDITIDKQGRPMVAFSDGCIGACVTTALGPDEAYNDQAHQPEYRAHHGTIARLERGPGLLSAYDVEPPPDVPDAPMTAVLPLLALIALGAVAVRGRLNRWRT
jgi:hypothetical protein